MIIPILLAATPIEATPLPSSETPVSYVISVVADRGECLFLPTDVGLTAKELTAELKTYNRSNGIVFIYEPGVLKRCLQVGRQAAIAAGFKFISARLATKGDEGRGSVPE